MRPSPLAFPARCKSCGRGKPRADGRGPSKKEEHRLKGRAQTEVCATVLLVLAHDVLRKESPALAATRQRPVRYLEVERIAASYRC